MNEALDVLTSTPLWNALSDGLAVVDGEGRMLAVNEALAALAGRDADDLCGQSVSILVPPDRRKVHEQHMEGYLAEPEGAVDVRRWSSRVAARRWLTRAGSHLAVAGRGRGIGPDRRLGARRLGAGVGRTVAWRPPPATACWWRPANGSPGSSTTP